MVVLDEKRNEFRLYHLDGKVYTYPLSEEWRETMPKLTLKCECGDGFVIATSENVGAWDDFRAWGASLGLWMSQHDQHGEITLERSA